MTADDLAYIIPYILVKAKIERLMSNYNYIMAFHYSVNEGDMISVVQTNLKIAIKLLKNDFNSHIEKYEPKALSKSKALAKRHTIKLTTEFALEQNVERTKRTSEKGTREAPDTISIEETKS